MAAEGQVGVLHLEAAGLLVTDVVAAISGLLNVRERIAQAAERGRRVAARLPALVEMEMEHLVRRREHPAVLPVEAHEVVLGVTLVPEDGKAFAAHREHVEVRPMPVPLLIRPDRHLRGVGMHGAIGHDHHHVRAPLAPRLPFLELEPLEVGDEIGLPGVPPGLARRQFAVALVEQVRPFPVGEAERVVEHELVIVEQLQHHRQVGRR